LFWVPDIINRFTENGNSHLGSVRVIISMGFTLIKILTKKRESDYSMKKGLKGVMFLFSALLICGNVSAAANIDLYYTDTHNHPVDEVQVGETIASNIVVQNDGNSVTNVVVEQSYHNNNQWINDDNYYTSLDGGNAWAQNPSSVTTRSDGFTWQVGSLLAQQKAILRWPGTPVTPGYEVMNVQLYLDQLMVDSDTANITITSAPITVGTAAKTVGMQETGSPLNYLFLALALIFGGLIFSKDMD
jgi:hypothetical protein